MKKNIFFFLQSMGLLLAKMSSLAAAQEGESTPLDKEKIILQDGELLVEGIGKDFTLQQEDMLNINNFIDASDPNKSVHNIPVLPVVPLHPGY